MMPIRTKLLFLDVDGVLNRFAHSRGRKKIVLDWPFSDQSKIDLSIDAVIASRFGEFFRKASLEFPSLKIVLSSTWRDLIGNGSKEQADFLFRFLADAIGIDRSVFADCTEPGIPELRDDQIESYVIANGLSYHNVVVVDDSPHWFASKSNLRSRLVTTKSQDGFLKIHGERALMLLRGVTTAPTPKDSTSFHIECLLRGFIGGYLGEEESRGALARFNTRKVHQVAHRTTCSAVCRPQGWAPGIWSEIFSKKL